MTVFCWLLPILLQAPDQIYANEYLKLLMSTDPLQYGKFTLFTELGDPEVDGDEHLLLLYIDEDQRGFTSGVNVKVDNFEGPVQEYAKTVEKQFIRDVLVTIWTGEDVTFNQQLWFSRGPGQDYCGFLHVEIQAINNNIEPHDVGIRLVLDTKLGTYSSRSDGSLIRIPGQIPSPYEQTFREPLPLVWALSEDKEPAILHAFGLGNYPPYTSDKVPDSIAIALLGTGANLTGGIYESKWSYQTSPTKNYREDTAIGFWKGPRRLKQYESFSMHTEYGPGYIGCLRIKSLAVDSVKLNNRGFYTPNPVTITATIQNRTGLDIEGYEVEIKGTARLIPEQIIITVNRPLALFANDVLSIPVYLLEGEATTEEIEITIISPCTTSSKIAISLPESPCPQAAMKVTGIHCVNDTLTFNSYSTGFIETIEWQFPDTVIVGVAEVKRVNFASGEYLVKLIAKGYSGCNDTTEMLIKIDATPVASFIQSSKACQFDTLMMQCLTEAPLVTWKIDGQLVGNDKTLGYYLIDSLSHRICLTVVSEQGCHDDTCIWVKADPLPVTELVMETVNWCQNFYCVKVEPYSAQLIYRYDVGGNGSLDRESSLAGECFPIDETRTIILEVESQARCQYSDTLIFELPNPPANSLCSPEIVKAICLPACIYPNEPFCLDSVNWSYLHPLAAKPFSVTTNQCINTAYDRLIRNGEYKPLYTDKYHPELLGLSLATQYSRGGSLVINLPVEMQSKDLILMSLDETNCIWKPIESSKELIRITANRNDLNGVYALFDNANYKLLESFDVYPIPVQSGEMVRLQYQLGKLAEVTITMFNATGGMVNEIINTAADQYGKPGEHIFELPMTNAHGRMLANGAYTLRVKFRSGSESVTKELKLGVYR